MAQSGSIEFVQNQGPVVRRVDNFIQQINPYPVDKIGAFLILIGQRANFVHWTGIYPLDKVIHSSYNRAQIKNTWQLSRYTLALL